MEELRFDDVESLKRRVGEPFSPYSAAIQIPQDMIDRFATLTGDVQWIHVDVERAKRESPLRTTIAHGFLLVGLIPQLRVRSDLRIVGHANVLNYGADKLRFLNPVPAGASVRGRARIYQVEQKAKGVLVGEEIEVSIVGDSQGPDRPALSYSMLVLYQGLPADLPNTKG